MTSIFPPIFFVYFVCLFIYVFVKQWFNKIPESKEINMDCLGSIFDFYEIRSSTRYLWGGLQPLFIFISKLERKMYYTDLIAIPFASSLIRCYPHTRTAEAQWRIPDRSGTKKGI